MSRRPGEALAGLGAFIGALRKPHDEPQLTQVIAAIARDAPVFSRGFLQALLAEAPTSELARSLHDPPQTVACRAEVPLYDADGNSCGRVDLVFEDPERTYRMLVELKLASTYGDTQLGRYRDALSAGPPDQQRGLIAVTTATPFGGEEAVQGDPFWLGSVRWYRLFERLQTIEHPNELAGAVWCAWLDYLRAEGDFGPMDFDPADIEGWARREQAEWFLFKALTELAQPTEELLRKTLGAEPGVDPMAACLVTRGGTGTSIVHPWKNKPNVQYRVPANSPEHRFRIQFLASGGKPHFTIEARYEHPRETLDSDDAIREVTEHLGVQGFKHGRDGEGYYWARVHPAEEWLNDGPHTIATLETHIHQAVQALVQSGIFDALNERTPVTPAETGPPDEE